MPIFEFRFNFNNQFWFYWEPSFYVNFGSPLSIAASSYYSLPFQLSQYILSSAMAEPWWRARKRSLDIREYPWRRDMRKFRAPSLSSQTRWWRSEIFDQFRSEMKQETVFIGSDCIYSYLFWCSECSIIALWVLPGCSLTHRVGGVILRLFPF